MVAGFELGNRRLSTPPFFRFCEMSAISNIVIETRRVVVWGLAVVEVELKE
jgi:hypothetical protein